MDSLPLEWDHTGDVGGSSSHEEGEEEEEDEEEERPYFSALSGRLRTANAPRWGLQWRPGHKSVCMFRELDPGFCSGTAESSPGLVEAADTFVKGVRIPQVSNKMKYSICFPLQPEPSLRHPARAG